MSQTSPKQYKCSQCGYVTTQHTNHYLNTYSAGHFNTCPKCIPAFKYPEFGGSTTWICIETKIHDATEILQSNILNNLQLKISQTLSEHHVNNDTINAINNITNHITKLILENNPIMIAPRLTNNKDQNKITLLAAINLGAQWIININNNFYLFATEENMNSKLSALNLPKLTNHYEPQLININNDYLTLDSTTGNYGKLLTNNLHHFI